MTINKWDPRLQMGWYRERNQRVCEMVRRGVPTSEVAFKFNITPLTVNRIMRAFKDGKNGG